MNSDPDYSNDRQVLRKLNRAGHRMRRTAIVDDDFPEMKNLFDLELARSSRYLELPRPNVVCLCGSTKFKQEFFKASFEESMAGNIVLSVGFFHHADKLNITPEQKKFVDELHLRKIDLADEVLVINVGGYVGESTRNEINYALGQKKPIRYLEPVE